MVGSILILGPDAAKFIYEVTQKWKGQPTCNPQEQINRLMTKPKRELYDFDRLIGAATTVYKYLASATGGYGGWDPTGCDAVGIGQPIRNAQKGSDGFWTVDVALSELRIQNKVAPPGRFIRLEILPDRDSSTSAERHPPTTQDVIGFKGPLVWDGDSDPPDHPHGHMEMHPMAAIEFFVPELRNPQPASQPEPQQAAASTPTPATPSALGGAGTAVAPFSPSVVPTFVTTYIVTKHACLSKIAERIYGRQLWRKIYAANRKIIRNPDIIYPGQVLSIPPP